MADGAPIKSDTGSWRVGGADGGIGPFRSTIKGTVTISSIIEVPVVEMMVVVSVVGSSVVVVVLESTTGTASYSLLGGCNSKRRSFVRGHSSGRTQRRRELLTNPLRQVQPGSQVEQIGFGLLQVGSQAQCEKDWNIGQFSGACNLVVSFSFNLCIISDNLCLFTFGVLRARNAL